MKKAFLWSIVSILLIYSGAWFAASRMIESQTHTQLTKLKKEGSIEEYSGDIEVSGFPFSFNIKFIHPRVKFRQAVSVDALFDGILTMNLGLFSSKITAALSGDLHLKLLASEQSFNLTTNSKDFSLGVRLRDSLILTAIKLATGKDQQQLPISGGSLSLEEFSLTNKSTNKNLLYAEEMNIRLNLSGPSNDLSINLYEHVKNAEFQEGFNTLSNAIRSIPAIKNALNQMNPNARNYFDVFSPDKFGRISHEMDLSFNTTKSGNRLSVDKFRLRDDLQEVDLSGNFSFGETAKVDGNFSGKFSERWYNLMKIYVDRLDLRDAFKVSDQASTSNQSLFASIFSATSNFMKTAFLNGNRAAYVPKLHEMGRIEGNAKIAYTKTPGGFYIEANKINLKTQEFGAQVSGRINSSTRSRGDTYELKAKLNNYQYIVDTAIAYINRISSNMHYAFSLSGKQLTLSPAVASDIKTFMREVSDNPEASSNDLNLTAINKDGGKYPQVGRYNSKEFGTAWNNFVLKIIFMEAANKLNDLNNMLKNPLGLPNGTPEDLGKTVKDLAGGLMGLLGK